jgi:small GTP-binding protein
MTSKKSYNKKIILIGNFGVGKTSLVQRYVHSRFSEQYHTTLGVKVDKKVVEFDHCILNMMIWDVAGEVRQEKVPPSYYLGSKGVFYVFDMTRPSTYEHIEEDLAYVKNILPEAVYMIVGNKKDLVEEAPVPCDFMTSAKTGENVEAMFRSMAQKLLEQDGKKVNI